MPKKNEKRLVRKIEYEYERKGYGKKRSRYIANATVYSRRNKKKRKTTRYGGKYLGVDIPDI